MSLLVRVENMKEAVKIMGLVKTDGIMPLGKYIKLIQKDGHIEMTSRTTNSYINTKVPVATENINDSEIVNVTVDKETLKSLISRISDDLIISLSCKTENDNNKLIIHGNNGTKRFQYYINAAEDKIVDHELTPDNYHVSFEVVGSYLSDWINMVSFAVNSKDNTRPQLAGIHIRLDNNKLYIEGTDATMLSRIVIEDAQSYLSNLSGSGDTIIPIDVVRSIENMCRSTGNGTIRVKYNSRVALIENDNTLIQVNCIEYTYPDTQSVIAPDDAYTFFTFDIQECIEAINRLTAIDNNNFKSVRLRFSGDLMHIENYDFIAGHGVETINIINDSNSQDELSVSIDARRLLMILKNIRDVHGDASIGIMAPNKPVLFIPANENTYNHKILIMPVLS